MMRVEVYTTPRADADELNGWRGHELQVRVRSAPEAGRANDAVCALLARSVGIPKSSVRVVRGHSSRHKLVEMDGVTSEDVAATLGRPDDALF